MHVEMLCVTYKWRLVVAAKTFSTTIKILEFSGFVNQGQQNDENLGLYRMITHWKLA